MQEDQIANHIVPSRSLMGEAKLTYETSRRVSALLEAVKGIVWKPNILYSDKIVASALIEKAVFFANEAYKEFMRQEKPEEEPPVACPIDISGNHSSSNSFPNESSILPSFENFYLQKLKADKKTKTRPKRSTKKGSRGKVIKNARGS